MDEEEVNRDEILRKLGVDSPQRSAYGDHMSKNSFHERNDYLNIITRFSSFQTDSLFRNGENDRKWKNINPVVYFEIPKLSYKFLLTELNPIMPAKGFGLCDYNSNIKIEVVNFDQLGAEISSLSDVNVSEIFYGAYNLAVYAKVADYFGTIITDHTKKAFKSEFEMFASGKNIDSNLNLQNFNRKFTWE